jgi:type I restriction enzyme S subunit
MSEIKDIPKHWTYKPLGDILDIQGGSQPPKSNFIYEPKDDYIQLLQIRDFGEKGHPTYVPKKLVTKFCKKDDILIARYGASLGRIVTGNEGAYNVALAKVIDEKGVFEKRFIFYLLKTPIFQTPLAMLSRSAQNGFSKGEIAGIELPIPPLSEQQAIVAKIEELLSELDNGKQQLLTAQQQLKVYRQSLLKWAFEGRLTNKNIKEGELPKGWKWVKLGDVVKNVEYGSATKSKKEGKVPVLRMGNIQNGKFVWDDLVYTDDKEEIEKYLLKKGDVLFNRTNSAEWVGKTAEYKGERKAIFAGYLIRINRIEDILDSTYLTYYLNTHTAKQYGNTVRSFGVNQSNINGTKLKTYPLPLPPLKEQQQIVEELESKLTVCDKIEETISQSLQQAETLRQSILKKAFEGRLV